MSFCHECGKPVVPASAKFCRICGAFQGEEAQLPIMPAVTPLPVFPTAAVPKPGDTPQLPLSWHVPLAASPQVPVEPAAQELCSSCSSPLSPDEKYCGICGSPAGEHPPAALPEPEIPAPAPASGCASCGSPLFEKGKFCGMCGADAGCSAKIPDAKGVEDSPATVVQNHPTSAGVTQQVPPTPPQVCASCGSPLSGMEKFCGICGKPVQFTSPAPPASPHPAGKMCGTCGYPISATTKFCGGCGTAVGSGIPLFKR